MQTLTIADDIHLVSVVQRKFMKVYKVPDCEDVPMTEAEMIAWIDHADLEALLSRWRFEPTGSPWFVGAVAEHYSATMKQRQAEVGPAAWTDASKNVGWG
jgi:hypothetical protein